MDVEVRNEREIMINLNLPDLLNAILAALGLA